MLRTTRILVAKDLTLFVRDRTALFFAFALPIMLGTLMGAGMGKAMSGGSSSGIPSSAGASHAFASMGVMMLLFNLVAAAGSLQEERAEGTLDRLRLTPTAGKAVLLSKLLVTMIMGIVQMTVLFVFGALAFDVPVLENLFPLICTAFVWAFAASALGLLFATASRTRKQLEGLATLVILGMSAVGGAWFPRAITPEWFQKIGLLTPVAWAMDAFHGVLWYGQSLTSPGGDKGSVGFELVVLTGIGALMLVGSVHLYRRRFDGI